MTKKISDKDLKDWEIFTSSKDKLYNKDNITNEKSIEEIRSIDLHGYTLDKANQAITEFIIKAHKKFNCTEVLSKERKRLHGVSKVNKFFDGLSILINIIKLYFKFFGVSNIRH